jgi:hypothetical protein
MRGGRRQVFETAVPGALEILPGRQRREAPVPLMDSVDELDPVPFEVFAADLKPEESGAGVSRRQLVASEVLWHALGASPYLWRRSITLDGELMSFYCGAARLALEIIEVDGDPFGADELADGAVALRRVPIPIADVEQRCTTIVGWLDTLCASRVQSETQERSASWLRRGKVAGDQAATNGASAS